MYNAVIKFRAQRYGCFDWVYGDFVTVGVALSPIPCIWDSKSNKGIPVDGYTLGQYTGFDDINGKEIYVGDRLKFEWGHQEFIWGVAFFNGSYVVYNDDHSITYPLVEVFGISKVVGNIY